MIRAWAQSLKRWWATRRLRHEVDRSRGQAPEVMVARALRWIAEADPNLRVQALTHCRARGARPANLPWITVLVLEHLEPPRGRVLAVPGPLRPSQLHQTAIPWRRRDHSFLIALLIATGADPHRRGGSVGQTAAWEDQLSWADWLVFSGEPSLLTLLFEHHPDWDAAASLARAHGLADRMGPFDRVLHARSAQARWGWYRANDEEDQAQAWQDRFTAAQHQRQLARATPQAVAAAPATRRL